MSELQGKFQDIVKRIEDKIKDKEELNFIKEQIAEISLLFMDQLDKVVDLNEDRLNKIIEREMHMEERIQEIENIVKEMQKEFYLDDNYDFEIVCPYCNYEFVSDFSQSVKEEIECPECHNIIELDWNNNNEANESCSGHCSCCEDGCEHEFEEDYDFEEDEFADYDVHEVDDMDEDIEDNDKGKNNKKDNYESKKSNKAKKDNSTKSISKKNKMKENQGNNETKNDNDDDDM